MEKNTKKLIFSVVLILIFIGAAGYILKTKPVTESITPVTINPSDNSNGGNSSLLTFTDPKTGTTFQYPADIGTKYITSVDWPPQVGIVQGPITCTQPKDTAQGPRVESRVINGHTYCVTSQSEGAAGSTYTNYAYIRQVGNQNVLLLATLRFVQCGNYPAPEMAVCQKERDSFNFDPIADQIISSLSSPATSSATQ